MFKVGETSLFYWNPQWAAPVSQIDVYTHDLRIEAGPDTFFTTDHHRGPLLVLVRTQPVGEGWVCEQHGQARRRHVLKTLSRQHP